MAEACDRAGFKYAWSVEHHFLEEYSHISASEIVLPWIAARTKRIHVGSAIWNLTPPVNHPARTAERVAMLDHLSEGRFEFGTGRGSSSTEFKGFGIPDGETTKHMFDEALGEILRMWREPHVQPRGPLLLDAAAEGPAEAVQPAAPADLDGVRQSVDVREGGAHGRRRALLRAGNAEGLRAPHQDVQGCRPQRGAGRRLRQRQHRLRHAAGLPGRPEAGAAGRAHDGQRLPHQPRLPVPRHLPAPGGRAGMAAADPRADARAARGAHPHRQPDRRRSRRVRRRRSSSTPTSAAIS